MTVKYEGALKSDTRTQNKGVTKVQPILSPQLTFQKPPAGCQEIVLRMREVVRGGDHVRDASNQTAKDSLLIVRGG